MKFNSAYYIYVIGTDERIPVVISPVRHQWQPWLLQGILAELQHIHQTDESGFPLLTMRPGHTCEITSKSKMTRTIKVVLGVDDENQFVVSEEEAGELPQVGFEIDLKYNPKKKRWIMNRMQKEKVKVKIEEVEV